MFLQKKMFGLRINMKVFFGMGSHNLYKCNIWDFYKKKIAYMPPQILLPVIALFF